MLSFCNKNMQQVVSSTKVKDNLANKATATNRHIAWLEFYIS